MSLYEAAKQEAREAVKSPTEEQVLRRWWTKKYKLPSTHSLFEDQTLYDLLVEFFTDDYADNPIEAHRNENGDIQFKDTGDPYIDKWEEELASGQTPDLMEMFTADQISRIVKRSARSATAGQRAMVDVPPKPANTGATLPVRRDFRTFGDD